MTHHAFSIAAADLQEGMWICKRNPRFNQRVVEVLGWRNGEVKIHADYGSGGEPATQFYGSREKLLASWHPDAVVS